MEAALQQLVQAAAFRRFITGVILLAGLLAGLETSAELRARYGDWFQALDTLVLVVFVVELGLRIASHGRRPWHYFRDGWNVFDFLVVALCCFPMDSPFAAVLRLARVLRLLRLVTALPRLQLLVGALLHSFSSMGYVGLLLALLFYIYGVAGVHLFGDIAPEVFGSLSASLLTLFRLITLDNWSDLFALVRPAAPVVGPLFFVSFILLGTMIMLNLFIGVIMNSMSDVQAETARRRDAAAVVRGVPGSLPEHLRMLEEELEAMRLRVGRLRADAGNLPAKRSANEA